MASPVTTTIHEACAAGNLAGVLDCIKSNPESYRTLNAEGKNALTVAKEANQAEIVAVLQKLPADVIGLWDAMEWLNTEVNDKQAKTMALRGETTAELEALECERVAKVKSLMEQMDAVKAESEAKKAAVTQRSKASLDKNNADLEQTMVLLEATRILDRKFVEGLAVNLASSTCEETFVFLKRAGVNVGLAQLQEQQVNGEVLQHNYKDAAMLNSIGITQMGQRMRCQMLVEHLVAGLPLSSFRFNEAAIPENEAFEGSFETWPAWRVAQFITEQPENQPAPNEAQANAARLAAAHFAAQQIAGDVLDRPEFAELLKGNLGNVPFGAMDVAVRKCLRLVSENPRTNFVAASMNDVKLALSKDEQFQAQKLEICGGFANLKTKIPESLKCKLTECLMDEAVMTDDGNVYDRFAISAWFDLLRKSRLPNVPAARTRLTSPITGAVITARLRPCPAINSAIHALISASDPFA